MDEIKVIKFNGKDTEIEYNMLVWKYMIDEVKTKESDIDKSIELIRCFLRPKFKTISFEEVLLGFKRQSDLLYAVNCCNELIPDSESDDNGTTEKK